MWLKRTGLRFLGGSLLLSPLLPHASFAAVFPGQNTKNSSAQFMAPIRPPPGFEDFVLDVPEENYISVYYGNTFLGNTLAKYNSKTITFTNIESLVMKIQNVKNPQLILKALQENLPTNGNHLCPPTAENIRAYCSVISPEVAGVIFDENNYRATIFINPKYLAAATSTKLAALPDSNAGLSYVASNNFAFATSELNKTYSLNNVSVLGYTNNNLDVEANFTQTNSQGVSTKNLTLQQVTFNRLKNNIYYQLGMITPEATGGFLGGPTMLGVSMQNYGILPQAVQGTPISVFLPLPATVSVYRNGYLIATQSFNAGKQSLDTTAFPSGSYMITLKIVNSIGQTTTQTQFFVKQQSLPPSGDPNYQVSLGFLQSNSVSSNSNSQTTYTLPHFAQVPLFSYNELRRFGIDYGVQSVFMTTFNRAYLSENLNYYGTDWQISPGVLVSNNKQYGWLLNFSFLPVSMPDLQFNSNNQKILNSQNSTLDMPETVTSENFSPVAQTSFLSNNILSWTLNDKTQLSASQTYNKPETGGGQMQYGLNLSRTLYNSELYSTSLDADVTKATSQSAVFELALTLSFDTVYDVNAGLSAGYGNNNTIQNADGSSANVYKPTYTESLSKNMIWGENSQNTFAASASLSQNYNNNTDYINVGYNSTYLASNFNYTHTLSKQYTNTNNGLSTYTQTNSQFSGNILNNIAITGGGIGLGYAGQNNTGIMADIEAPGSVKANVYINSQNYGSVSDNSSRTFFVLPYQTYQVTIQPEGATEYGFDTRPKIVTLYSGNVAHLKWVLNRQYILFAKIVDPADKPLVNMLMESLNPSDFNTTDEEGYLQASLSEDTRSVAFRSMSGETCAVSLDPAEMKKQEKNGLVVLDKPLVCESKTS